jgi:hypothetical protein
MAFFSGTAMLSAPFTAARRGTCGDILAYDGNGRYVATRFPEGGTEYLLPGRYAYYGQMEEICHMIDAVIDREEVA